MDQQTETSSSLGAAIDVARFIDGAAISPLQWRVVALCFLVAFVDGYDLYSMALAAPIVASAFGFSPNAVGAILSSSLVGLMVGAFVGGPVADRYGRKPVIVASCVIMGVMTLATVTARDEGSFLAYRFLTGLGLGAAMPTINALTSEYAPFHRRALLMTMMFIGVPLGNVVGSLFAGYASSALGWQAIFLVGGVIPLLLSVLLLVFLPESLQYLVRTDEGRERAAVIARQVVPSFQGTLREQPQLSRGAVGSAESLFSDNRAMGTILIWGVFFLSLFTTFSLASWLPSVLRLAGFPLDKALYMSSGAGIGVMVGALMIAYLIDRFGYIPSLVGAALLSALALVGLGFSTSSLLLTVFAILLAGASVGGLQIGLNALAAHYYPSASRSTGLGWALAVGRVGAIIGPILMGILITNNWSVEATFALVGAPGLLTVLILLKLRSRVDGPSGLKSGDQQIDDTLVAREL
ncbi:MAG: MFS transporter [Pseudomonadota bacterium]